MASTMLPRDSEPKAVRATVHSSLLMSVDYASDQTLVLTFRSGATYIATLPSHQPSSRS